MCLLRRPQGENSEHSSYHTCDSKQKGHIDRRSEIKFAYALARSPETISVWRAPDQMMALLSGNPPEIICSTYNGKTALRFLRPPRSWADYDPQKIRATSYGVLPGAIAHRQKANLFRERTKEAATDHLATTRPYGMEGRRGYAKIAQTLRRCG